MAASGARLLDWADAVLATACRRIGLSDAHAKPLRVGTNALYHLVDSSIVVRIGLTPGAWPRAEKEIRVAQWLTRAGLPCVKPASGVVQPVAVAGLPVTFWEWIRVDPVAATATDLGATLRRLHALPGGNDLDLPRIDPLGLAARHLAEASRRDPAVLTLLRNECATLSDSLQDLIFDLPGGPVHGDAHPRNLLRSHGRAVLIDLETFGTGPREWDLIPMAVHRERFGLAKADHESFVAAYGFDVRSWRGYSVLRRVREVLITSWLLTRPADDRRAATELNLRIASLRDDRPSRRWHAV